MLINPLDRDALRQEFQSAKPFPHVVLENFISQDRLDEIVGAYPKFDDAWTRADELGRAFNAVNEKFKIQITDSSRFPTPVAALNDALASKDFISDLEYITGI